jgi:hypothetical protein
VWCVVWWDAVVTDEWCGLAGLWEDAWWLCDLWGSVVDVAAATGEALKAATGRTRPRRANRCLREVVTG